MVSRPLLLPAALGAAAALTAGLLSTPVHAAAAGPGRDHQRATVPAAYDAPLLATIDELTPGEVPRRGPVVVKGTVINRDVETWSGIRVYPFINAGPDCHTGCPAPITTKAGLVEAAEVDPETVVGARITDARFEIEELGPGEVETYSIRIPRNLLPVTTAGVYWFGVHALGASESTPDDDVADGRARTFLPYVPRGRDGVRGQIDTAVVVPVRYRLRYRPNGKLSGRNSWENALAPTGELGAPLAFGSAAATRPVTWLVDPAVPDAARQLRRGSPPRDLGPEGGDAGDESPTDEPTTASDEVDTTEIEEQDPLAAAAGEWLDSLEVQLRGEEVLALPYGDIDMSATPARAPELYRLARERVGDVFASWETPTQPVIASPGGYLDPSSIPEIGGDSLLLLTDRMFERDNFPAGPPALGEYGEHPIAATSYGSATGGPGPEPRLSAVAFRQRVLAEAVTRLLSPGQRRPLVVVVPRTVDGGDGPTFWSEMDVDWINLTTLTAALDRPATAVDPDSLTYPLEQETVELPSTVLGEAEKLIEAGTTLQNVLPGAGAVTQNVVDEALSAASYHYRTDTEGASARLERSRRWIERQLRKVGIDGPRAVTLSSADGTFSVTVINGLNRTVTVQIAAESDDGEVEIDAGEPVVLAADSRTTILLDAHTRGTGVHNVTLTVTDADGTPLGSSVEVPIRSGQVSEVIWVILGAGVGILFVAIGLRIFRRIRGRGRAPTEPTTEGAT